MIVAKPAQVDGTILAANILAALPLVPFSSQVDPTVATAPLLCAVVVVSQLGHCHLAVGRAPLNVAVVVVPSAKRLLVSAGHGLGSISGSLLLSLLLSSLPLLQAPPVFFLLLPLSRLFLSFQLPFCLALLGGILRVAKRHEEASVPAEGKSVFWLGLSHLTSHPEPCSNQPSVLQPVVSWALGARPPSLPWSLRPRPMPSSTTPLHALPKSSAVQCLRTLIEAPVP